MNWLRRRRPEPEPVTTLELATVPRMDTTRTLAGALAAEQPVLPAPSWWTIGAQARRWLPPPRRMPLLQRAPA